MGSSWAKAKTGKRASEWGRGGGGGEEDREAEGSVWGVDNGGQRIIQGKREMMEGKN